MDIQQIYKNGEPYTEGPNVLDGTKGCPRCKSNMIKKPVGTPYVKQNKGCTLVTVSSNKGKMNVFEGQYDSIWTCTGCTFAETIHKKRIVRPIE